VETVTTALSSRFALPRFKVYAVHGLADAFIGWQTGNGVQDAHAAAAVLVRFAGKGHRVKCPGLTLFRVEPTDFLDLIWLLIEQHAIVHQLTLPDFPIAERIASEWQHHWSVLLTGVPDLRRRRSISRSASEATSAAPSPPRSLSQKKAARFARNRSRLDAEFGRAQRHEQARAVLEDFKDRLKRGEVQPPTAWEAVQMEMDVLDLYFKIKRSDPSTGI
jgi:hypothetical protein